jgi:excinuclease UvrABC helicase subunit UvrB
MALLQTVGRAACNANGTAVFYANRVTESMRKCIEATMERRESQIAYNSKNGYESRSTKGSSIMSIFDLLKEEIEEERKLEVIPRVNNDLLVTAAASVPLAMAGQNSTAVTDHLPSKPGVYFWKD